MHLLQGMTMERPHEQIVLGELFFNFNYNLILLALL